MSSFSTNPSSLVRGTSWNGLIRSMMRTSAEHRRQPCCRSAQLRAAAALLREQSCARVLYEAAEVGRATLRAADAAKAAEQARGAVACLVFSPLLLQLGGACCAKRTLGVVAHVALAGGLAAQRLPRLVDVVDARLCAHVVVSRGVRLRTLRRARCSFCSSTSRPGDGREQCEQQSKAFLSMAMWDRRRLRPSLFASWQQLSTSRDLSYENIFQAGTHGCTRLPERSKPLDAAPLPPPQPLGTASARTTGGHQCSSSAAAATAMTRPAAASSLQPTAAHTHAAAHPNASHWWRHTLQSHELRSCRRRLRRRRGTSQTAPMPACAGRLPQAATPHARRSMSQVARSSLRSTPHAQARQVWPRPMFRCIERVLHCLATAQSCAAENGPQQG